MTQKSEAQKGNITPEMEYVAEYENMDVNKLARLIDKGLVVIPKNINGHSKPCGIGEGLKTKINANIGSSSKQSWPRNMAPMHLWTFQQVPI